jgi:hypothetical protein
VTLAEILGSAGIAALTSGVVAVVVASLTANATVKTARISAGVEQSKLGHEQTQFAVSRQDLAQDDLLRAVDLMKKVGLEQSRLDLRQQAAGEARQALIKVDLILGGSTQQRDLEELLHLLDGQSEEELDRAVACWPNVETALRGRFSS